MQYLDSYDTYESRIAPSGEREAVERRVYLQSADGLVGATLHEGKSPGVACLVCADFDSRTTLGSQAGATPQTPNATSLPNAFALPEPPQFKAFVWALGVPFPSLQIASLRGTDTSISEVG